MSACVHVVVCCVAPDLPDGLRDQIQRGSFRGMPSDYDVITLVKKHISSQELAQAGCAPLLTLPERMQIEGSIVPTEKQELREKTQARLEAGQHQTIGLVEHCPQTAGGLWRSLQALGGLSAETRWRSFLDDLRSSRVAVACSARAEATDRGS
eukprot:s3128_g4.t1